MQSISVLAFDYGLKNIGVATGQSITRSASELKPIKARDGVPNWDEIAKLLKEWEPNTLVIGLPLNMDGTETGMAIRARKFSQRLHGRFGLPVSLIDERLSTREAKEIAARRGHKGNYREAPIDSIAASVLLEDWWRQRGSVNAS